MGANPTGLQIPFLPNPIVRKSMKPDSCNKPCDLTKHGPKDSIKARRPLLPARPACLSSFPLSFPSFCALWFAPLCFSLAAEAVDDERGCAHTLTNIDQTGQLTFATDRGQEKTLIIRVCV